MIKLTKTITTIFMVPTLKVPKGELINNGFLNGYVKDELKEDAQYKNSIYLLFKPKEVDKFKEFLDSEYERTKHIIEDYNHPNGFVVVVYKLDDNFALDFQLIRQGKYSKTSPSFQELFPKTTTITLDRTTREELSLQYRVFNRTEDLVKYWEEQCGACFDNQELWKGFDIEDETLTEEKLKQYDE